MSRSIFKSGSVPWRSAIKIILPLGIIVGWEVLAIVLDNQFILPRLESVFAVLINPFSGELTFGSGSLVDNAIISLERVIAGFLVAANLTFGHDVLRKCLRARRVYQTKPMSVQ